MALVPGTVNDRLGRDGMVDRCQAEMARGCCGVNADVEDMARICRLGSVAPGGIHRYWLDRWRIVTAASFSGIR